MFSDTFNKLAGGAVEVCRRFVLSEEARPLLAQALTARQFFDLLVAQGHLLDAVRFLAAALPRREAVWWACACIGLVQPPGPSAPALAALEATEKWVAAPTDDNRRAAFAAAEKAEYSTPAGCAGAAAFFSGGSLTPANLPVVPPAEHLTATAVANAVQLASVLSQPEKANEKLERFLGLGLAVADGKHHWKEDRPAPKPAGPRQ